MKNVVAGVDGCPAGWIAVLLGPAGTVVAEVVRTIAELAPLADLIAIDIPIGLTDRGPRSCDAEVRTVLKQRRNSVFPAPIRPALGAAEYDQASAISRQVQGKGVSKQAFEIYHRIRQVDAWLDAHPEDLARTVEIHPELCFTAWNGMVPMQHPKRTAEGKAERRVLIDEDFGSETFAQLRGQFTKSAVADDDLADAFAALWTGLRISRGQAKCIPSTPPKDPTGKPMAMWY